MLSVTQEQAFERWDTLPENLREALTSEQNADIVERISEAEHIPPDRIPAVKRITGWVLMGFLHPEEAKKELQDAVQLDPQHAQKIADDLNSRIFNTFRADLDRIYAPPGAAVPQAVPIPAAPAPPSPIPPKPMEEIRKPETGIKPSPEFELKAAKFFGAQTPSVPKPPAPAGPPRPPVPGATPAPAPAPFIMRKEIEMKPLISAAPHLELTGERGGRGGATPGVPGSKSPAPPPPAAPARLEIGKELPQAPKAPTVARTEITPPKVVHYSDMKTPLPPTRTAEGVVPVPLTEFGRVAPPPPRPSSLTTTPTPAPPTGGPRPPSPPPSGAMPRPAPPSQSAPPAGSKSAPPPPPLGVPKPGTPPQPPRPPALPTK